MLFKPHHQRQTKIEALVAPCKGIRDSLGFWIPCCGFRIPGTASSRVDSGFQKELDSIFFPVLMLFFALRFRVRILLYWKTLLEGITSLFLFRFTTLLEEMYYSSVRVYGIRRGTLGDRLHRNTAEKNNKHHIAAKKRSETPTSQFKALFVSRLI